MKRVYKGYIGKTVNISDMMPEWASFGGGDQLDIECTGIYKIRGDDGDWCKEDWPPHYIEITVEIKKIKVIKKVKK